MLRRQPSRFLPQGEYPSELVFGLLNLEVVMRGTGLGEEEGSWHINGGSGRPAGTSAVTPEIHVSVDKL